MSWDARKNELRELVRNQYPGPEVGTVDESAARELEKRAVIDAVEKYGTERSGRLDRALAALDSNDAEKNWIAEISAARTSLRTTFADSFHDVKTPTILGLKIVIGGTDEEDKVYDALDACRSVGAALDAIAIYRKQVSEKAEALTRKWDDNARKAEEINRSESDVLEEIRKVMRQAADSMAEKNKNRRELVRKILKLANDALPIAGAIGGTIGLPPLPPEVGDTISNTNEAAQMWENVAADLAARKARFEGYFSQDHTSLLVMFRGNRDDARAFLNEHDYLKLVTDWTSKARKTLSDARSAARTSGQKTDIEGFASAASDKLDKAEKAAKDAWDTFVRSNPMKFFGAFSPDLEKALIGTDKLDARYREIASIDLQGLLFRWIDDGDRDWREIDAQEMPDTWHSELRQSFKQSLDRLSKTEKEIAANNSSDMLQTWTKGKISNLVNLIR